MVLKILYATEDEKVEVDDAGNLNITNANGEPIGDEEQPAEDVPED